jgi:hypothetical protein
VEVGGVCGLQREPEGATRKEVEAVSAPDGFTRFVLAKEAQIHRLEARAQAAEAALATLTPEYRPVGEHEWPEQGIRCVHGCTWTYTGEGEYVLPACPSVQERRLVGPWEAVRGGITAEDWQDARECNGGGPTREPVRDEKKGAEDE